MVVQLPCQGKLEAWFQVSSLPGGLVLWHSGEQMLLQPPTVGEVMLCFRTMCILRAQAAASQMHSSLAAEEGKL